MLILIALLYEFLCTHQIQETPGLGLFTETIKITDHCLNKWIGFHRDNYRRSVFIERRVCFHFVPQCNNFSLAVQQLNYSFYRKSWPPPRASAAGDAEKGPGSTTPCLIWRKYILLRRAPASDASIIDT